MWGGVQATDGPGIDRTADQKSKKPAKMRAKCLCFFGSPTWARTRDLRINSQPVRFGQRENAIISKKRPFCAFFIASTALTVEALILEP